MDFTLLFSSLQCILRICDAELEWLDMRVNPNKSSCVRFGARYSIKWRNILTSDSCKLVWTGDSVRYLGVYLRSARSFACSYSYAKKECIEHSMQFSEKLGELHSLM